MKLIFLKKISFKYVLLGFCFWGIVFLSYSQESFSASSIDPEVLNQYILKEVNLLRKKEKAPFLVNETALRLAAFDHATYMRRKHKLTHKEQKRIKRTPKNRVDLYGSLFDRVGENVQLIFLNQNSPPEDKVHPRITTYAKLAEQLVAAWKKSPPHYANMINPDFYVTYTAISVGENGAVYACQLFGSAPYQELYKEQQDTVEFKPDRWSRCWRCHIRPPEGVVEVTADSMIVFTYYPKRFMGFVVPPVTTSRMRFFNPWRDGLAADIIVKSQYTCDGNSNFNGMSNFRGIPLPPVYKKQYMGILPGYTSVVLGKVPSYIKEDFEVNLVVIQNKRPCSNTLFYKIPSSFYVDIPLSYGLEPMTEMKKVDVYDTLYKRMYFDKAQITPNDTALSEIIQTVEKNKELIQSVEISGFASIEGSTEANEELYQNRAEFLIQALFKAGIDTLRITTTTHENFKDFRSDVLGTDFEYLKELTDLELKEKLADKNWSKQLEFILSRHRYVAVQFITLRSYGENYDKTTINRKLKAALEKEGIGRCEELQRMQYGLILEDKMTVAEMESVPIPKEKKYLKLWHNRLVMKYTSDILTVETLYAFQHDLQELKELKKDDKRINTSLAIIDYYLYTSGEYWHKKVTFYDSIRKWKYMDEVQRARILLNVATHHDWSKWKQTNSFNPKKYWYRKVRKYIGPAHLNVDKTFELASYYSFFRQHKYAYNLTRGIIDETDNPQDLIFFLKLIHLTNVKIPRQTYLNYFRKIRKYSGKEFCKFFNSPALNFQILDDPEIKKIYCEECRNR